MWVRWLAGPGALGLAANGLDMLLAPADRYASLPSASHTGPYNAHFVRDVGAACLACAAGIGLCAWRVPARGVALVSLGIHARLHRLEWGHGKPSATHATLVHSVGVCLLPVLLAVRLLASALRSNRLNLE
ncbi:MAG: hypothetical protein R3E84_09080 [Pseudomonadales bacterium]